VDAEMDSREITNGILPVASSRDQLVAMIVARYRTAKHANAGQLCDSLEFACTQRASSSGAASSTSESLAFRLLGLRIFFGEIRADRVLAIDLGGDTQNIRVDGNFQ